MRRRGQVTVPPIVDGAGLVVRWRWAYRKGTALFATCLRISGRGRIVMSKPTAADLHPVEDLRWLTSSAAEPWLAQAAGPGELTRLTARLRRDLSPERTHLVLEQVALRKRARDKFSHANAMFFSPKGLEQATDELLAGYKALRFAAGTRIADLCVGIGGDLLALAARGAAVVGVEHDPGLAVLAEANLRAVGLDARASLLVEDALAQDLAQWDAWHVDPDRRPAGRRTTRVELHEPSAEALDRLLAQNSAAGIKLVPAAEPPDAWQQQAELEWISTRRQCRQLVAWFGALAVEPGRARATTVDRDGQARSVVGTPGEWVPTAASVGRFVFEPDAAVLAAKLEAALAAELNLLALAPEIAYWTGDQPISGPADFVLRSGRRDAVRRAPIGCGADGTSRGPVGDKSPRLEGRSVPAARQAKAGRRPGGNRPDRAAGRPGDRDSARRVSGE